MRGRASGFGAKISSIGLVIVTVVSGGFVEQIAFDAHWANHPFDEGDLFIC